MLSTNPPAAANRRPLTTNLLIAGAAAGPLHVGVGVLQALFREGYDPTRHPLSVLSNGSMGWIQIANFLASGLMVLAGSVGLWQALRSSRGGMLGPLLLAVYGVGLIGAGVFVADPMPDFPPGAAAPSGGLSSSGALHFMSGGIGFFGLIGACLVFAAHFLLAGRWVWALYSGLTGVAFLAAFMAIASGSQQRWVILAFTAAVAAAWAWIFAVMIHTLRRNPEPV